MNSRATYLIFNTKDKIEFVNITKGKLDFGPWEQIFYGEFDGQRPKRVLVKIIGE